MGDRLDRDRYPGEATRSLGPEKGPSGSQALAVATLLPVGGGLLALVGITLVGSLIGLAVLTPLFLLFSPVLVPAALLAALAVAGFLSSGVFGIAGLSSLGYLLKWLKGAAEKAPEHLEQVRRRVREAAGQMGQKAREAGHAVQGRAEEERGRKAVHVNA